jgi:hypothetical protein
VAVVVEGARGIERQRGLTENQQQRPQEAPSPGGPPHFLSQLHRISTYRATSERMCSVSSRGISMNPAEISLGAKKGALVPGFPAELRRLRVRSGQRIA